MAAQRQPRVRSAILRLLLRVPFLRRRWIDKTLTYIEEGGTAKRPLPPELQAVRGMLMRMPKHQRAAALETALRGGAPPQAQSRELRRAAAREAKRGRRR